MSILKEYNDPLETARMKYEYFLIQCADKYNPKLKELGFEDNNGEKSAKEYGRSWDFKIIADKCYFVTYEQTECVPVDIKEVKVSLDMIDILRTMKQTNDENNNCRRQIEKELQKIKSAFSVIKKLIQ